MHINFKFGKRDQKKYSEAIDFLENIDEGDRSRICKQALLYYARAIQNGENVSIDSPILQSNQHSPIQNKIDKVSPKMINKKSEIPQPSKSTATQQEEDYMEISVSTSTNENNQSNTDVSAVDKFLDFDF